MIGQMVTWICLDFCDPYLYFDIDCFRTFQPPSHANLEVLEKKPRKTWRLGPPTWRLQKYASNKNKIKVINANAAVTLLEQRPEKNFRL